MGNLMRHENGAVGRERERLQRYRQRKVSS